MAGRVDSLLGHTILRLYVLNGYQSSGVLQSAASETVWINAKQPTLFLSGETGRRLASDWFVRLRPNQFLLLLTHESINSYTWEYEWAMRIGLRARESARLNKNNAFMTRGFL